MLNELHKVNLILFLLFLILSEYAIVKEIYFYIEKANISNIPKLKYFSLEKHDLYH